MKDYQRRFLDMMNEPLLDPLEYVRPQEPIQPFEIRMAAVIMEHELRHSRTFIDDRRHRQQFIEYVLRRAEDGPELLRHLPHREARAIEDALSLVRKLTEFLEKDGWEPPE